MTDTTNNDAAVWLENLAALYRAAPRLAQAVDDLPADDRLVVEPAKNGQPTMKVTLPEGRAIYLHSKYDPGSEAKKFVDGLDLDKNFVFIVSGIGLGYQLRELFDRASSQTYVVVFEPELSVIRAAIWHTDFSGEIRKGRLIFMNRADKGLLHAKLTPISTTMMLGTSIEALTYTGQWHAEFHKEMRSFFTDFMSFCRMSYVTMLGNSKVTQTNVANNLADYVCCPTIDSLRQKFAGHPAIVVAAGPSLAKNSELLKEAKGKAVIIAVQTMFKPLQKMGVEPDFVTSLDYSEISRRFFEGVEDFGQTQLVAEPKASWAVLDIYKGQKRLFSNEFADLCLGPMAKKREALRSGSTVAHLSLYLAEYLGANPIIMIGQDLGFTDNQYYAPGNPIHDIWSVELNRFYSLEMKEWERIVRNRPILRKVEDIYGRQIFTDEQMFTYLQQFERDFAQSSATIIDATEGGARKRNTVMMTLAEALAKYAHQPIPAEKFEKGKGTNKFDPTPLPDLICQLKKRIEETEQFKALCEKTRELVEKLQGLLANPRKFNKLIAEVDEIRSVAGAHAKIQQMVCNVSTIAEMRRFMHDRHLDVDKTEGSERAKHQLSRDVEYMKALITGCDELRTLLEQACERAEKAQKEYDERR
jgi:hypothetical protein